MLWRSLGQIASISQKVLSRKGELGFTAGLDCSEIQVSDEGCSPQCASSATHEPLVPGEDLLEELKSRTLSQCAIQTRDSSF